jgi:hypothetical protein
MSEQEKPKKPLNLSHKYELQEYNIVKKAKQLFKDGHPVKCHKCGPQFIPNPQLGSLVPVYEHCSSHCTRALLGEEDGKVFYIQTCEVQNQKFLIENAQVAQTKESKLII